MGGRKRLWLLLALGLALCLPLRAGGESASPAPEPRNRLRALLIGCDHFLSQEDTWPAADNNLRMLGDTLLMDQRRYALIRSYSGSIASVDAFEEAVVSAFGSAGPYDISLLYISTHGIYDDGLSTARAGADLDMGIALLHMSLGVGEKEHIIRWGEGKEIASLIAEDRI